MPESVTLSSYTFTAARLLRVGGELIYNDELIPIGAQVMLGHALSNVASLILEDGRLVPVLLDDITEENFVFIGDVEKDEAAKAVINGARLEVIVGNPIAVYKRTVLRRTGRPFMSIREHYAQRYDNLTVSSVSEQDVWYDTSWFRHGHFDARYLTDAYFEVVN